MTTDLSLRERYARGESVQALADEYDVSVQNLLSALKDDSQAGAGQGGRTLTRAELEAFVPQWSAEHPKVYRMRAATLIPHEPQDRDFLLDLLDRYPTKAITRGQRLVEQIKLGRTLESIAGDEGLTRERVRQIIKLHDAGLKSLKTRQDLKAAQQAERLSGLLEQARQVMSGRRVVDMAWLREQLQCSPSEMTWLMAQDLPGRIQKVQDWQQRQYSDEDIFDALREVASRVGSPSMSNKAYDKHRDAPHPSGITIIQRLGWSAALQKAGLSTNKPRRTYSNRRSDTTMLADLRRFLREHPQGRAQDYEEWRSQDGNEALSLSSISNRLGTWSSAVRQALGVEES